MGNKLPPLKRREIIEILLHNGFVALPRKSTSHMRYRGVVDGRVVLCDVDASHDEFIPTSRTAFYWLVTSQLGITFARFYAGHPDSARRARLGYQPFGSAAD